MSEGAALSPVRPWQGIRTVEITALRVCRFRSVAGEVGGEPGDAVVSGDYVFVQGRLVGRLGAERALRVLAAAPPTRSSLLWAAVDVRGALGDEYAERMP